MFSGYWIVSPNKTPTFYGEDTVSPHHCLIKIKKIMELVFNPNPEESGDFQENNRIVATMTVSNFKKKFKFSGLTPGKFKNSESRFLFDTSAKRPVAYLSTGIQEHLQEGGKLADLELQILLFVPTDETSEENVQALLTRVAEVDLSEETL